MKHITKALSVLLAVLMLFSLCACSQPETDNTPTSAPEEIVIPETIFCTWYSHPEIGVDPIVVNADGTCVIKGKTYNWQSQTVTEENVILIAGGGEDEYTLTFSQLTFTVPLLGVTGLGIFNQYRELWKYSTEWYSPETGESFALSFFDLAQAGCKLTINGSDMTVEVIKDGAVTHTIELSDKQAIVTDAAGNSTTFEPMN